MSCDMGKGVMGFEPTTISGDSHWLHM